MEIRHFYGVDTNGAADQAALETKTVPTSTQDNTMGDRITDYKPKCKFLAVIS